MINTIGLAHRARKVAVGTDMTITRLRTKNVFLIVLATNASHTTKKKVYDKAKTYGVEVIEVLNSDEISRALGKEDIKVIGITDRGFSQLLMNQIRK
ncbi:MAG: ribosomal L7Ae/L30e/S12e/Gadd45 family protein [Acholeplasmataceae bacterium]|jgi:ribosomal protein L7Ae-like RNA K-turn-binding protein|nr:ribosomal L7Ae/L30e/S12e/Gadd45 family protein [Acholeplasmataceae bacterium]MDD4194579.1 ribosomal L7Ae/L30e/S12e/Gadd45 family protein [Acholeplasmataceae bacterium]MDY0338468.1 ribosomal L7Ae/L30e/S12e/Gadd45 family protein [Acholeplasmataceae bacterium]